MAVYMQYTFAPVVGYSISVCKCLCVYVCARAMLFIFLFFFLVFFFSFSGNWNSRYSTVYAERTLYVHVLVRTVRVRDLRVRTGGVGGKEKGRKGR